MPGEDILMLVMHDSSNSLNLRTWKLSTIPLFNNSMLKISHLYFTKKEMELYPARGSAFQFCQLIKTANMSLWKHIFLLSTATRLYKLLRPYSQSKMAYVSLPSHNSFSIWKKRNCFELFLSGLCPYNRQLCWYCFCLCRRCCVFRWLLN